MSFIIEQKRNNFFALNVQNLLNIFMENNKKDKAFSKFFHCIVDDYILAKLKGSDAKIYGVLCRFADYTTRIARPTILTIAKYSGVHKSRVSESLKRLVEAGLIKMWRDRRKNYYYVLKNEEIETNLYQKQFNKEGVKKVKRLVNDISRDPGTGKFISPQKANNIHPQKVDDMSLQTAGHIPLQNAGRDIETDRDIRLDKNSISNNFKDQSTPYIIKDQNLWGITRRNMGAEAFDEAVRKGEILWGGNGELKG